jgi:hypothetical protein
MGLVQKANRPSGDPIYFAEPSRTQSGKYPISRIRGNFLVSDERNFPGPIGDPYPLGKQCLPEVETPIPYFGLEPTDFFAVTGRVSARTVLFSPLKGGART